MNHLSSNVGNFVAECAAVSSSVDIGLDKKMQNVYPSIIGEYDTFLDCCTGIRIG